MQVPPAAPHAAASHTLPLPSDVVSNVVSIVASPSVAGSSSNPNRHATNAHAIIHRTARFSHTCRPVFAQSIHVRGTYAQQLHDSRTAPMISAG
jgi:hypothetical protein